MKSGLFAGPRSFDESLQLAELHIAERDQNVFFAWEIIEERALADVSRVCNVLDGSFREAFFGKKSYRGAEESFARFGASPASAIRGLCPRNADFGWNGIQ